MIHVVRGLHGGLRAPGFFRLPFLALLLSLLTITAPAAADNLTRLGVTEDGVTMWRLQNDAEADQQVVLERYGGGFTEVFTAPPGRTVVAGGGAGTYIAEFDASGAR